MENNFDENQSEHQVSTKVSNVGFRTCNDKAQNQGQSAG